MTIRLYIDGHTCTLLDIRVFRTDHDLPDTFGVAYFEPKDYTHLGSIEQAGNTLNSLRNRVLDAIPRRPDPLEMPAHVATAFESGLREINARIGLREPEIDFARANFEDIVRAMCFEQERALHTGQSPRTFEAIYHDWLFQTVRVCTEAYRYLVNSEVWVVQVIHHAFGRVGLRVKIGDRTHYLFDPALACPAEGFTVSLLRSVCQCLESRFQQQSSSA